MIVMPAGTSVLTVIDPGFTTGIVHLYSNGTFSADELGFDKISNALLNVGDSYREKAVFVAESFRITVQTPKNTQAPWSLELIGVARAVSRLYTGRDLVLQDPSAAKRFASDVRLKHMGWHTPGKGHANDAARHLLLFCATRGIITPATLKDLAGV